MTINFIYNSQNIIYFIMFFKKILNKLKQSEYKAFEMTISFKMKYIFFGTKIKWLL